MREVSKNDFCCCMSSSEIVSDDIGGVDCSSSFDFYSSVNSSVQSIFNLKSGTIALWDNLLSRGEVLSAPEGDTFLEDGELVFDFCWS